MAKANQRSVIDASTLEAVQATLIKTVNDVIKIQQDGVKHREETTLKLKNLQETYNKSIVSESVRIAYKENK